MASARAFVRQQSSQTSQFPGLATMPGGVRSICSRRKARKAGRTLAHTREQKRRETEEREAFVLLMQPAGRAACAGCIKQRHRCLTRDELESSA